MNQDKTGIVVLIILMLALVVFIPVAGSTEENVATDLSLQIENTTARGNPAAADAEALQSAYAPAASASVAGFSGSPLNGTAPLDVSFTDTSTNTPTGWSWNFGDTWWASRNCHSSVALPDGKIVVMGGATDLDGSEWTSMNDTWVSQDLGSTWSLVNGSSGWVPRRTQSSAVLSDGTILVMGGNTGLATGCVNDVWASSDGGATWTLINASTGWQTRELLAIAVVGGDTIVVGGGVQPGGRSPANDVWQSTDHGATWTRLSEHAPWGDRFGHAMTAMPDGSIILTGGHSGGSLLNDVWRSTDNGTTWTRVATAGWTGRYGHTCVAMPDGSLVLAGGYHTGGGPVNDVWRSTDYGVTWTRLTANAGWPVRYLHTSVVLPDSSIVLTGGSGTLVTLKDDVWRSTDNGTTWTRMSGNHEDSVDRNPVHTYTGAGVFSVLLNATNSGGSSKIVKTRYVAVERGGLIAGFTATPITGTIPLTVTFTDISTGSPTSWLWDFGDGNTSSLQNPVHTYYTYGTHPVNLTVTNSQGSNITVKPAYIMGTGGSFTVFVDGVNDYHGTAVNLTDAVPLASAFYDTMEGTNADTTWTGYEEHYDDSAGSKYWSVSESSAIKADYADFALFAGHGNKSMIAFGTANSQQQLTADDMEFGAIKAKWVTFAACLVLNESSRNDLKQVFKGLHILNGYDTEGFPYGNQGTQFVQRMKGDGYQIHTIRNAWSETLQDTINIEDENKYFGAWMWAEPCSEDHLPGYGTFCSAPTKIDGEYDIHFDRFNME